MGFVAFFALSLLGLSGLSLATWLVPVLVVAFHGVKSRRDSRRELLSSLDILIPAHNESETLPKTIRTLLAAKRSSGNLFPGGIQIHVGLSNWTGPDALHASQGSDRVLHIPESGKWTALVQLVENSRAQWIALVDSGSLWPPNLLIQLEDHFRDSQVMGISPRYSPSGDSIFNKLFWWFEAQLKSLENSGGGPVSVHGATVFYRRNDLQAVLPYLAARTWMNDDVVIPLTLRTHHQTKKIIYRNDVAVFDLPDKVINHEPHRRRRILFGNAQWVRHLFPEVVRKNPLVAFISLRRIFRMMWAWWVAFGLLAVASIPLTLNLVVPWTLTAISLAAIVICLVSSRAIPPLQILWESLLWPKYLYLSDAQHTVRWK